MSPEVAAGDWPSHRLAVFTSLGILSGKGAMAECCASASDAPTPGCRANR